jgi:hypothetical protein
MISTRGAVRVLGLRSAAWMMGSRLPPRSLRASLILRRSGRILRLLARGRGIAMSNATALSAIALSALLLTAGCRTKTLPGNQTNATQTAQGNAGAGAGAGEEAPPAVDETVGAAPGSEEAAANDTTPVKNLVAAHNAARSGGVVRIVPRTAPPAAAHPTGFLARYVDMRPREVEDGRSFLGEPAVRRAVAANVRDAGVRDFIFHYNGPDAPIAAKNGRILAWGCEARNCGFHNWSVSITPDGSSAEICYYQDDERPDGSATWYLPRGRTVKRAGNCPDE